MQSESNTQRVQYVLQDNVVNEIVDLVDRYQMQENTRLPVLREELHGVDRKINNLLRALENGIVTETTKQRLDELELQRNTLQHSIDQEQVSVPILAKDEIKEWLLGFKRKDLNDLKIQKYVMIRLWSILTAPTGKEGLRYLT